MPYSTLANPKRQTFFQIREGGLDKRVFIFQKFQLVFFKRVTEELFDYYGIVFKEKQNKI